MLSIHHETVSQDLELLEPFGHGNESPLVRYRNVRFAKMRTMGQSAVHCKAEMQLGSTAQPFEMIGWHKSDSMAGIASADAVDVTGVWEKAQYNGTSYWRLSIAEIFKSKSKSV
jgi:single-stranded DNA-specific DHH superfamily exonuclease